MQRIFDDVAKFGWHVVAVTAQGGDFAFTVGLFQTYEHPELVVFGLPMKTAHGILLTCVERIEHGDWFDDGQVRGDVLRDYTTAIVAVDKRYYSEYLGSAIGFYDGTDFPALQIVWPDKENRFPWQAGYDSLAQMVFSMTAA